MTLDTDTLLYIMIDGPRESQEARRDTTRGACAGQIRRLAISVGFMF